MKEPLPLSAGRLLLLGLLPLCLPLAYLQTIRTQPHPPPAPSEAQAVPFVTFSIREKKIVWVVLFSPTQTKKQAGLLH